MHANRFKAACLISTTLLLGGCQTQEQTSGLFGGVGGAAAGGLIGQALGGRTGALIGAALGGTAGYFAGSAIGRKLDQQDRESAEAATRQALAAPVVYPSNTATTAPPPRAVVWNSAQNTNVRGAAAVTQVQRQADGGECRMVRETAYVKGEEVIQSTRYCRRNDGQWVTAA